MRRRRARYSFTQPENNLDSFLDILTNTVGVLTFIGLFVSLVAVEAGSIIRTPLTRKTDKESYFLEVRGNEIIDLNSSLKEVESELEETVAALPKCIQPSFPSSIYLYEYYLERFAEYTRCLQQNYETLANFSIQTNHYNVKVDLAGGTVYEPRDESRGESASEINEGNSRFQEILAQLDPEKKYLAFIVRPDSYEIFRLARKLAWKEEFDVGWEPQQQELPLVFGSSGRKIDTQ